MSSSGPKSRSCRSHGLDLHTCIRLPPLYPTILITYALFLFPAIGLLCASQRMNALFCFTSAGATITTLSSRSARLLRDLYLAPGNTDYTIDVGYPKLAKRTFGKQRSTSFVSGHRSQSFQLYSVLQSRIPGPNVDRFNNILILCVDAFLEGKLAYDNFTKCCDLRWIIIARDHDVTRLADVLLSSC